MQYVTLIIRF